MTPLAGRHVVLGVTGGIAAYKAVEVCRRLVDMGIYVVPVMTEEATRFVGAVTFSALASEPVRRSLWSEEDPIPHTTLGQRADLVVVVPATARFLAAYAAGLSDGLLTATVLATRAPVLVCPAMHTEMWEHPAVRENLATLRRRGVHVVEPDEGRLAGGDVGAGRLAETARIVSAVVALLDRRGPGTGGAPPGAPASPGGQPVRGEAAGNAATTDRAGRGATSEAPGSTATTDRAGQLATTEAAGHPSTGDLAGKTVLVSAGGTREPIDPVRYITNRSSGKQGHALADAAADRGARVVLVTTTGRPAPPGAEVIFVETAAEMAEAVLREAPGADVVLMAAAVADFRPAHRAATKLPKAGGAPRLILEPTLDILAELGRRRRPGQILVGFAAQTGDPEPAAEAKLRAKGVDMVVANDVSVPGAGFDGDTNAVVVLEADGRRTVVPLTTKRQVADAVFDRVVACLGAGGWVPVSADDPGTRRAGDMRRRRPGGDRQSWPSAEPVTGAPALDRLLDRPTDDHGGDRPVDDHPEQD